MRPTTMGFESDGGTDFCNHPVSIGDQDGLATGGEPDTLTELIFEQFETDGAHAGNVVLRGYIVHGVGADAAACNFKPRQGPASRKARNR